MILSLKLAASYIQTTTNINVIQAIHDISSTLLYWILLLFSSFIVMTNSTGVYLKFCKGGKGGDNDNDNNNNNNNNNNSDQYELYQYGTTNSFCPRTILGISSGTLCILFSAIIIYTKIQGPSSRHTNLFLIELAFTIWIALLTVFEVAYVTGDGGPGAPLGNLFYFSWFAFFLSIAIANECHELFLKGQHTGGAASGGGGEHGRRENNNATMGWVGQDDDENLVRYTYPPHGENVRVSASASISASANASASASASNHMEVTMTQSTAAIDDYDGDNVGNQIKNESNKHHNNDV